MTARAYGSLLWLPLLLSSCRDAQREVAPPAPAEKPVASGALPAPEPSTKTPAPKPAPTAWPPLQDPEPSADFCTDRVHVLDEDACFALPSKRTPELLIYLHGIVPPTKDSVQKTNFEKVVANAAERAGAVALIPRGKQGLAPAAYPGWWGWPTTAASYARQGAAQIEKIRAKKALLEEHLGTHFDKIYLAGSSSGAYFVAAILVEGGMPEVSAYGIMSGAGGYQTKALPHLAARPVYIGFGKSDSVASGARAFGRLLSDRDWPVELRAHPVPHGAREVYLDEAFGFWRKGKAEP